MKSIKTMYSFLCLISIVAMPAIAQKTYHELYRPQAHFSPKEKWINDPNGMVFYKGVYHLFFQYYPDSTVWGPMHWGHATSKDLIHWKQLPIALFPDSLGYIFSGSAVIDKNNTSGFGKNGQVPMVAIFTHHDPKGEKEQRDNYENESIAYSLDEGNTWTKYADNPVLKNPGIKDFRDPKVMWHAATKNWVMTLATKDRVTFYSSSDLKNWVKETDFGSDAGAHGGVWECPDLFSLDDAGKTVWVLVANINPGGPNKGSATQYFLGDFDGHQFKPFSKNAKWLDYGPDEYAGITWSNTGKRKIFLGWMSNWLYANVVPTATWRNAMTIPRELQLKHVGKEIFLTSQPVAELSAIQLKPIGIKNLIVNKTLDLTTKTGPLKLPCKLDLSLQKGADFSIELFNDKDEKLIIGYDKKLNQYFIDRTASGKTDFQEDFAAKHTAPRLVDNQPVTLTLIIDESSVELFADNGLSVMTELFFAAKPYDKISIKTTEKLVFKNVDYTALKSIWP